MKKREEGLSHKEIRKILLEEETGCLCMCRQNKPYAVPISYAFIDGKIIFHCGMKGKKLDYIRANPQVCFVISRHPDHTKPHHPEKGCNFRYESLLCFGKAQIVNSVEERLYYLKKFKAHFDRRLGSDPKKNPVSQAAAERTNCVIIEIKKITSKKR